MMAGIQLALRKFLAATVKGSIFTRLERTL